MTSAARSSPSTATCTPSRSRTAAPSGVPSRSAPGFLLEGKPVILVPPPRAKAPAKPTRTASGSVAVHGAKARVARQSRIYVEGRHDAELVEKVWGDDLRLEGVVVEYLGGVDDLAGHLRDFRPGPDRRVGVLVDHLVPGSKESRIADEIERSPLGQHVLVVGHPFVDVWAAVKPERLGLERWPEVPRNIEWKKGVCQRSAGRTPTRPTSRGPGGRSCRRSRRTTTSIRRCSGGSRSSSTSSPLNAARLEA